MNLAIESRKRLGTLSAKFFAGLVCAALAGACAAQELNAKDQEVDPPGRVGRLSEMTGKVWLFSPGEGEWLDAVRNRPITSGDRLATEGAARAEVRIGSTTVGLDSGSELEVVRIDDSHIELLLHNGSISARLRSREAVAEFAVRTGEGRFRALRTGRYRIDRIDESSHLTVNSGSAVYEGPGSALTVNSGQRAEFWIDAKNAAQYTLAEPKRDAFAAWSSTRDRSDDRSASTRYVSPEMTGVEELDRHGRWERSDEYGDLWTPYSVGAGWAPYSTGHWVWIRPWGWTWVDDAPWGFAPFHYGRWVYYRSNWCWAPGTRVHRPVYAPALVAWVGGPHVSVSVNIGGPVVGWFPLAPREVYVPSYRVSPRYVREVNYTHVTNITNITQYVGNPQGAVEQRDFSNRKFAHAVTVVPAGVFTQRQPVAPAALGLRERSDVRELTQGLARGATLVAAPVQAPAVRTLEAQSITAPGIGNAGAAGRSSPADRAVGPSQIARPWLRTDDQSRGAERALPGPAAGLVTPVAPAAQTVTTLQRPSAPQHPENSIVRGAPAVQGAPAAPAAPTSSSTNPPNPALAPTPSTIMARPAVPTAPANSVPAVPVPRSVMPPPATTNGRAEGSAHAWPPKGVRGNPQRPPGTEVAAPAANAEVRPPAAAPTPGAAQRSNPAVRQAPARAEEAAPHTRPAEPQQRERAEPQRQDHHRDARDRAQQN